MLIKTNKSLRVSFAEKDIMKSYKIPLKKSTLPHVKRKEDELSHCKGKKLPWISRLLQFKKKKINNTVDIIEEDKKGLTEEHEGFAISKASPAPVLVKALEEVVSADEQEGKQQKSVQKTLYSLSRNKLKKRNIPLLHEAIIMNFLSNHTTLITPLLSKELCMKEQSLIDAKLKDQSQS